MAPAAADEGEGVESVLAALVERIEALDATVGGHHDRAAARERTIDRLHEENLRLRTGERRLVLRPVLTDLHRLRNELLRQAAALPAELDADQVAQMLRSFAYSLELALDRCGVQAVRPQVDDRFDPRLHRATRAVEAGDPRADGSIAATVEDGYLDTIDDRVLQPAAVTVYRWTPAPDSPAQPTEPEEIAARQQ